MMDATERYSRLLSELERRGRRRSLAPIRGIDFASNDYLGLANSPELREAVTQALAQGVPIGAGASRLLRGNHPAHESLETQAAAFFCGESTNHRALYFPTGFTANFALWSLLPQRDDLVVHDELIHASCHQGMRAGQAATASAKHNDAQAFEDAIRQWRAAGHTGRPWLSVESLYSMDGDRAPLEALADIAARHDAMLVIDEAHASGVFGRDGRGLADRFAANANVLCLHTCGKAFGAQGALLCAEAPIIDFLVNRSRPFIYSTGPSPLIAAAVSAAIRLVREQPARRERLHALIAFASRELEARCGLPASGSQIIPIVVGAADRTMALAGALQAQGFDVRGIRPPTVPEGTSRLRVSLTLNVDEKTTGDMISALGEALQALPA